MSPLVISSDMIAIFWKTLFFYILLLALLRVMGKREIGSLTALDIVVTIMLAEAAIIAIEDDKIPVLVGVVPVLTLAAIEIVFSWFVLNNERFRVWAVGRPTVVVHKGKVLEQELRNLRYNLDDLLSQLRSKNVPNLADVESAILEPSGQLSVIPKVDKRPFRAADLGMKPPYEGLPVSVIMDGTVAEEALRQTGRSRAWLDEELRRQGVRDVSEVLIASVDGQGKLTLQKKDAPN